MRSLIITSLKLFLLFILSMATLSCFAGQESIYPVSPIELNIIKMEKLDSFLNNRLSFATFSENSERKMEIETLAKGRICSCQILNLESSNYSHRLVAVLAEKTNYGDNSSFTVARTRIQKEKKYLKKMFYDKVKVVAEMQGTGSCSSMFFQLKTADRNLQLYEILNADIN